MTTLTFLISRETLINREDSRTLPKGRMEKITLLNKKFMWRVRKFLEIKKMKRSRWKMFTKMNKGAFPFIRKLRVAD